MDEDSKKPVRELKFNTSKPQYYEDHWRGGKVRVCRFMGKCVCCHRRTYAFDDGENDPRGVLGDHAASGVVPSDERPPMLGTEVPACFTCMNEEWSYKVVMTKARKQWVPTGDPKPFNPFILVTVDD